MINLYILYIYLKDFFVIVNIMPTLTKGLLEVCKINPIDPIDYLADFLFTNSTGEK